MGAIELKMSILTGAVGGVLLILAELVLLHRKVSIYRQRLRSLYHSGRRARVVAEVAGVAAVALAQPVLISVLIVMALGNFNPAFSSNAVGQLQSGGAVKERPLRSERHMD